MTINQSQVRNYKQGQDEAVSGHLISICLNELEDSDPTYRQWLVSDECSVALKTLQTIVKGLHSPDSLKALERYIAVSR